MFTIFLPYRKHISTCFERGNTEQGDHQTFIMDSELTDGALEQTESEVDYSQSFVPNDDSEIRSAIIDGEDERTINTSIVSSSIKEGEQFEV